ncbi:Gfo/Idh/MocA family oxidoreductase [Pseudoclavibacter chungangensis]|uniref:Gfo/Idh/MocA family oxidoreductase n=1 Tax=Pseudoclavibacter chungangensis TaxID=587635 RepID=A0A7J5BUR3_9MICO|nr:Gfo/Idh/MocA family oxidoreductase [Pseudoclavibacter chungangensis]KAB1658028.1 Gfo/Idh/MocA family oxidoreductase [Pseudoclavibacter chungangensis]NYJ65807.1 putative dehydrogenase [Pseudoclavibacter chungangensis]
MTDAPRDAREIGVGLISVGWMGRLHSRAYTNVPQVYPDLGLRPRLVQAADTAEAGRAYARDVLGYASTTADYHEVLANPEVEVVSICAPNFLHAEIGIAAAKAGKPFWIEKPVGRGEADTAAVRDAAIEAGVATTIGFNYRHPPAIQLARKLVDEGALGTITNVRGRFFGGFNADPNAPRAWRFVREQSGSGVLGDLMGHLVDLVHFLLGPIGAVTASTGTFIHERPGVPGSPDEGKLLPVENEDYANLLIRFDETALASTALGTLDASWIAVGPKAEYAIEIFGTNGSLRWNFERMNELELAVREADGSVGYRRLLADATFPEFSRFQPSAGTPMGYDDLKTIEANKFLLAATGRPSDTSNIHDALASAQVLTAAEESAASGQWVATPVIEGSTANIRTGGDAR